MARYLSTNRLIMILGVVALLIFIIIYAGSENMERRYSYQVREYLDNPEKCEGDTACALAAMNARLGTLSTTVATLQSQMAQFDQIKRNVNDNTTHLDELEKQKAEAEKQLNAIPGGDPGPGGAAAMAAHT